MNLGRREKAGVVQGWPGMVAVCRLEGWAEELTSWI